MIRRSEIVGKKVADLNKWDQAAAPLHIWRISTKWQAFHPNPIIFLGKVDIAACLDSFAQDDNPIIVYTNF